MDITFEEVSYTYQPNTPFAHHALQDISFHIPQGTFVAIIGHTGSGKSTLIQHLNGLISPTSGKFEVGDFTITSEKKPKDIKKLRSKVGVVFQYPEHQLFEENVEKDIAFGLENFGVPADEIKNRIAEILPQVGLSDEFLNRSPFDLSGGQMRRVAIAGVLAVKPRILVLDEPTAGLDPRGQKEIMDMFYQLHQKEGITTILVTHSMEDALKYADYVMILNQGKLYMEGTPEEIFTENAALNKVNLDVPEIIHFIQQFNEKFDQQIPLEGQTTKSIAQEIQQRIKGAEST